MVYLRLDYLTPPRKPDPPDFIGPFENAQVARKHKAQWGPQKAILVDCEPELIPAIHLISPEKHCELVKARF